MTRYDFLEARWVMTPTLPNVFFDNFSYKLNIIMTRYDFLDKANNKWRSYQACFLYS